MLFDTFPVYIQHTLHERRLINNFDNFYIESILEICNVGIENDGEYLCIAAGPNGITTVSANPTILTVRSAGK